MPELKEIQKRAYAHAEHKGFHDTDPNILNCIDNGWTILQLKWLAMIGSEVGEAVEAARLGDVDGLAEELADIIIRVCNMAECCDIDLDEEVNKKQDKNEQRPYMHGGKLA